MLWWKKCLMRPTSPNSALEAEGMEKTFKFTQHEIKPHLDTATARKVLAIWRRRVGMQPYSPLILTTIPKDL